MLDKLYNFISPLTDMLQNAIPGMEQEYAQWGVLGIIVLLILLTLYIIIKAVLLPFKMFKNRSREVGNEEFIKLCDNNSLPNTVTLKDTNEVYVINGTPIIGTIVVADKTILDLSISDIHTDSTMYSKKNMPNIVIEAGGTVCLPTKNPLKVIMKSITINNALEPSTSLRMDLLNSIVSTDKLKSVVNETTNIKNVEGNIYAITTNSDISIIRDSEGEYFLTL